MHMETLQISNFRSQDVPTKLGIFNQGAKEIPSDLVRTDVTEFDKKFHRFWDAFLKMFKGVFNNY